MNKQKNSQMRKAMFLIVFAVFVYSIFEKPEKYFSAVSWLWRMVSTVGWGFAVAFLLNLVMSPIEKGIAKLLGKGRKKFKLSSGALRGISVLITVLIAFGLIAVMLGTIIPSVTDIFQTVIAVLPGAAQSAGEWLSDTVLKILPEGWDAEALSTRITDMLSEGSNSIVTYLANFVSKNGGSAIKFTFGVFGGIVDVILIVAFALYALAGKENVCKASHDLVSAYLPDKIEDVCFDTVQLANVKFTCFFRGQVIEAVLQGVLCFVGMLILGIPSAAVVSVLVATTSLVPVLGAWVGSIASVLLVFIVDPMKGLIFAIFILVLHQINDNVIYPRLVGKAMNLPGILVLIAVIIGSKLGGMIGIIIGVPMCAVIYELLKKYVAVRLAESAKNANADRTV